MAATHATGSLQSSTSCGIGATITSTTLDNSTAYGALITAKITNGATGPTVGCTATVNISPDGTTWYYYASQTGSLLALAVVAMAFEVPMHAVKAQVVFTGNTGQAVTVEAQYEQTTGI
jgi:Flp pilus assembly protein CpaB